jgi:hypothetical protein
LRKNLLLERIYKCAPKLFPNLTGFCQALKKYRTPMPAEQMVILSSVEFILSPAKG